ncbi:hypothetical protein J437_LFUL013022 [Ladona fulva]|uniref:G-protein coupled receptors family 1 profile domain-containing protein n=1 Tax=Ladona fulva TaxID=123851 RepID=A0A8K0KMK6_LADFU|nr:hypothetical protein J437_LFUL013022 [Ladona fulva]
MLTTVLNDSPVFPDTQEDEDEEEEDEDYGDEEEGIQRRGRRRCTDSPPPLLMDSPQCVMFGTFMIWFASITINLGPTFLSGALAANSETGANAPGCPLVHGPFRHYVLNVLWIIINALCVGLTLYHLRKLHRDLTKANVEAVRVAGLVTTMISVTAGGPPQGADRNGGPTAFPRPTAAPHINHHRRIRNYIRRVEREGVERVRMFVVITAAYVLFWGPLFLVTLATPGGGSSSIRRHRGGDGESNLLGHEVTLHVAYVHAFVNPTLFLCLHKGLRRAGMSILCCVCCPCSRRRLSQPPPPPPRAFVPPLDAPTSTAPAPTPQRTAAALLLPVNHHL